MILKPWINNYFLKQQALNAAIAKLVNEFKNGQLNRKKINASALMVYLVVRLAY